MKQIPLYLILTLLLTLAVPTDSLALFEKGHLVDYYEYNARECFKHKKWSEGKKFLDEGWEEYGSLSVMNELMGWYYYHYKKYDRSRFYLIRSLRDDKSNTHSRELIAKVEEETGNYSSAICYINELLESNPYSRDLWRRKINMYRKQGNHVEADRLLHRLAQIYPNDVTVKKDIAYVNELKLAKMKTTGNATDRIEALKNLVATYPQNPEYYLSLSNAYLQAGRTEEATETAGRGATITKSAMLMKKRADILAEQGRYVEALNYLRECQKSHPSATLTSTINDLEMDAANNAQLNDPYTAMARVYSKQHSGEALTYLLNTAIARGYYDDALEYIRDAKGGKGEDTDLMYKEYIVQRRLGNRNAALSVLTRLYEKTPNNEDVVESLAELRYEAAAEQMNYGQYAEAIPDLQFAAEKAVDPELRKGAMQRLFNCYYETKRYDQAQQVLDKMRTAFAYDNYLYQKAALLKEQGRTDTALQMLANEYQRTTDPQKAQMIAYQYEEYALPYIKEMVEKGMTRQADKAVKNALNICPTSNDLLHQAITTSSILGNKEDYEALVKRGREKYPEDPFFIVKEAGLLNDRKQYSEAVALLRPELDIYVGDSTVVGAFAESSMRLALDQSKAKAYNSAIATLDTALVYSAGNRELLYTKGLVYESMHEYDSAYVYQKYYKPTLMDYREHSRHLNELQHQGFRNELSLIYQQSRPGSEDVISANAFATYTRKNKYNDYAFSLSYAGRDGKSSDNLGTKDMESGGTGIQLGVDWKHRIKDSSWAFGVGAAWASKYFPEITLRAHVEKELKKQWLLNLHASYRQLKIYEKVYSVQWDEAERQYVYVHTGWDGTSKGLIQVGLTGQKTIEQFIIQGSTDVFMLNSKMYVNGQVKGMFYPIEQSKTSIYAVVGVGNAPQTELIDNSLPTGFSKLNTFVGAGLMWFFNKHIAGALSGTWYTMYRSQEVQTGSVDDGIMSITSSSNTDYKNVFYIQGQVLICF
jgi:tetratricopeptide (TPR) repeat protein